MLELISLALGGILRFIPELIKFQTQKREQAHELAMFDLQLKADELRSKLRVDEIRVQGEMAEAAGELEAMKSAFEAAKPTGVKWVDALSATVRPVLTYWYCLVLYGAYKSILLYNGVAQEVPLYSFATLLVNEFDTGVMASIIGFWFVDRSIRKRGRI